MVLFLEQCRLFHLDCRVRHEKLSLSVLFVVYFWIFFSQERGKKSSTALSSDFIMADETARFAGSVSPPLPPPLGVGGGEGSSRYSSAL
ncbi:hypothetical protein CEXT_479021 [Caerostris extrusa]|uniref:Uncharacterized protein n=1 Tax=Caerostris extrusa TaxID=172846 RepID=A0AAV4UM06_CAEEX|nr:hypothetical protein CEXT_479021 [Caerostris extrusa]